MSIKDYLCDILNKTEYLQIVTAVNSSGVVKVIAVDDDCIFAMNVEIGRKETEEIIIPLDKIVVAKAWYYPEVQ